MRFERDYRDLITPVLLQNPASLHREQKGLMGTQTNCP